MREKGYKKLIVWQKANRLAHEIYLITKRFQKEETYGLISQIRRAALSVPTNLVEGCGRQNKKELKQFTNIALGSLAETEYLLDFVFELTYLDQQTYDKLNLLRKEVGSFLWNFYKSL